MPATDPTPAPTVADLVSYWSEVRENGPLAATTVTAYLGAIARILRGQGITADTALDDLDLSALIAAFTAAHPDLRPATLTSITAQLRAAVNGYRIRNQPNPASPSTSPAPDAEAGTSEHEREPEGHPAEVSRTEEAGEPSGKESGHAAAPDAFDGTLAHLERFTDHARRNGLITVKTASLYKGAIRRILASQPHLATVPAIEADPGAIVEQYAADNPHMATATISNYRARLVRVIAVYTAYLAERDRQPPSATVPLPPVAPALEIPLPGARTVRFSAPPDLTDQEAAATGALLRLHHPGLATAPCAPGTWTLVFWPEHAPEEPEAAHLTGPSFRRALAAYIRTRCPELADHDDEHAIDAWYTTEVFVALAIDGHHAAHDSGSLL